MEMIRKVPWTKTVRIVTVAVFTGLIAGEILFCADIAKADTDYLVFDIFMITVMAASMLVPWVYAPLSITLTDTHLTLRRGIGNKRIEFSEIDRIAAYRNEGYTVRVFGSGGLCGFTGRFYHRKFGHYFAYVGDFSQAFSVRLKNGRNYVFSCRDRDEVVSFINHRI